MSRTSASSQCDSVAAYMDGVQVKIAEAYKPPKKIVVPAAYYNKLPDVSKYTYDLSLEKSVLDKMKEWRKARSSYIEARKARLEKKRKKEAEEEAEKVSLPSSPNPDSSPLTLNPTTSEITASLPQLYTSPTNEFPNHTGINGVDYSALDYSLVNAFDNDTSSPFDNMLLKAMNNTEELAQVLQPTTVGVSHTVPQWPTATNLEDMMNNMSMSKNVDETKDGNQIARDSDRMNESTSNKRTDAVFLIIQELQRELDRPNAENRQPWPDLECPLVEETPKTSKQSSSVGQKELARTLADLSPEEQNMAKRLSDMGFPLYRVARALCDLKGQDNKKIIEYLLAIQSLEDNGMPEDDAVKTLALFQNDQQKAKAYYKSLCYLRDLGFPEDRASMALLKCNIDRDSALDFLIA
ncbi:uncharacterized protein LOC131672260 [Phymastichus coffea]|uniref:uncharacterized protein LOC131672260 n=1 Tax=Phymastichus coffea TaxID=108790 RepID=UPI00273C377A|nr:uncharacterized protein LOC131672260 [Phymastichus coffea]